MKQFVIFLCSQTMNMNYVVSIIFISLGGPLGPGGSLNPAMVAALQSQLVNSQIAQQKLKRARAGIEKIHLRSS